MFIVDKKKLALANSPVFGITNWLIPTFVVGLVLIVQAYFTSLVWSDRWKFWFYFTDRCYQFV